MGLGTIGIKDLVRGLLGLKCFISLVRRYYTLGLMGKLPVISEGINEVFIISIIDQGIISTQHTFMMTRLRPVSFNYSFDLLID